MKPRISFAVGHLISVLLFAFQDGLWGDSSGVVTNGFFMLAVLFGVLVVLSNHSAGDSGRLRMTSAVWTLVAIAFSSTDATFTPLVALFFAGFVYSFVPPDGSAE